MMMVTGAAGFIGYQLVKKFEQEGKNILSVDDLQAFSHRPEHQDAHYNYQLAPYSILNRDLFKFAKHLYREPIEAIFHLGACTDTTELRVPYLNEINLKYSQALWNLATEFKIPFIYASSAATYGAGELGYEDDEAQMLKLKPLNPYGDSKLQFDLWVLEQEKLGKTPPNWCGFKFFNVYGFGERHKGKMASVVLQGFQQINQNKKLKLFKSHKVGIADGEQKRDFVFVGDVVNVLKFAYEKPIQRGIYNLGSGQARSFLDLARATFRAMQIPENIEYIETPIEIRERYQYFTEAKMDKLRRAGYTHPFTVLEDGVKKTVSRLCNN